MSAIHGHVYLPGFDTSVNSVNLYGALSTIVGLTDHQAAMRNISGSHLEIRVLEHSADIVLIFSSDGLGELPQELFFNDGKLLFIQQMKASLSCQST